MEPILLASTSPRRQEILKTLKIPFKVFAPTSAETSNFEGSPEELTEINAIKKVESVMRSTINISAPWILGADTIVSYNQQCFGKPKTREEAQKMISLFSGKTHQVITSICLFDASKKFLSTKTNISSITFMNLDAKQIESYLDTNEWYGVAGGYRIQGFASYFISRIDGSYSSIMGLPIHEFYVILREHGYVFTV